MKKALKITGIVLLIVFLLLMAIPFAFQSQIKDMVKAYINNNVNAQVEFNDINLSLLRSFPKAHVEINDLVITNFDPFKDETLATVKSIAFTMSVNELFKTSSDDPIAINTITIDEALLTLKKDSFGNVNYDISKADESTSYDNQIATEGFSFDIEDYALNNSAVTYIDESSKALVHISELNHSGSGKFSADVSELNTKSDAFISLSVDSTNYLKNTSIKLNALLGLDLKNDTYTFKNNTGFINQLPLEFKGHVKLLESGQDVDITFENPKSSFKDFLAIVPESYSKNLDDVDTSGNFKVDGSIRGLFTDETIPILNIQLISNDASFKYSDLPKRVENITIDTSIKNTTGNVDDTFIEIKTLNFKIDEDVFESNAILRNLGDNILVHANVDGVLNLGNVTKAYPITLDKELSGIMKAKISSSFDMNALETNAYERIKNNGSMSISNFIFSSEDIVNPIHISKADMTFKPKHVSLNTFSAITGETDFTATGSIENLLGFLLSDGKLQGDFNVNSNTFAVSDFMVESDTSLDNKTTSASESLKIPDFLDCTIRADAKTVLYDNLSLSNVNGILIIKDQQATLKNMNSNIFDGQLDINGNVSTQSDIPVFNMTLGAENFDISKSFKGLELLQNLAPVAKLLQGKLNTTISINGALNESFSPNISSVSGDAIAEFLTTKLMNNDNALFTELESALSFIDFDKIDLKDLKTKLSFTDGKVSVAPFNLNYEDVAIEISGSHGFDKSIAYNAIFNVPAKYLGSEVNQLIGRINDTQVNEITIPVTAVITGNYNAPNIKTDLSSSISKLTQQLIEIEKQKLLDKGKGTLEDLLGGIIGNNSEETNPTTTDSSTVDSTKIKTDPIKEGVKSILNDVLSGKKKKKDTIN